MPSTTAKRAASAKDEGARRLRGCSLALVVESGVRGLRVGYRSMWAGSSLSAAIMVSAIRRIGMREPSATSSS